MQEDYLTSVKIYSRGRVVVFLLFFHFCLVFVLFSGPSLTEMKFYKN